MLEYAFRRVLWVIPVIVSVAAVTFFLMYRAPGGPWDREKTLPAATVKALDAKFGLDKPLWVNP
jgi:oligopeptide transport system permease protein